jgi:NADP-dependent 3-hydroxy acid dehydrogenase YdfG
LAVRSARKVLAGGNKAAITARIISDIIDFEDEFPETALLLSLDVTNQKQIDATVAEAKKCLDALMFW